MPSALPTNAEVSETPTRRAGDARREDDARFRARIFLLHTAVGPCSWPPGKLRRSAAKVAPLWLTTWACECAWQLVFANAPLKDGKATGTTGQKLAVFVPSVLFAGGRLREL